MSGWRLAAILRLRRAEEREAARVAAEAGSVADAAARAHDGARARSEEAWGAAAFPDGDPAGHAPPLAGTWAAAAAGRRRRHGEAREADRLLALATRRRSETASMAEGLREALADALRRRQGLERRAGEWRRTRTARAEAAAEREAEEAFLATAARSARAPGGTRW